MNEFMNVRIKPYLEMWGKERDWERVEIVTLANTPTSPYLTLCIRKVFFLMQQKPTQKPTPAWEIPLTVGRCRVGRCVPRGRPAPVISNLTCKKFISCKKADSATSRPNKFLHVIFMSFYLCSRGQSLGSTWWPLRDYNKPKQ